MQDEVEINSRDGLWVKFRFVDPRLATIESRSKGGRVLKDKSDEPRLHLEIKAHPDTDHRMLTELVRTKLSDMGIRAAVMPFTYATGWIQFLWIGMPRDEENSAITDELERIVSSSALFKPIEEPSKSELLDTRVKHPCQPFSYRSPYDGRVHYRCAHCSKEYETEDEAKRSECGDWSKPVEEPYLYCSSCKEMTVHWISSDGARCRPCGHINT